MPGGCPRGESARPKDPLTQGGRWWWLIRVNEPANRGETKTTIEDARRISEVLLFFPLLSVNQTLHYLCRHCGDWILKKLFFFSFTFTFTSTSSISWFRWRDDGNNVGLRQSFWKKDPLSIDPVKKADSPPSSLSFLLSA